MAKVIATVKFYFRVFYSGVLFSFYQVFYCKNIGFIQNIGSEIRYRVFLTFIKAFKPTDYLKSSVQKQEEDPTNIYFSNLPDWIDDKALREMLEPYGDVVSTRILRHQVSLISHPLYLDVSILNTCVYIFSATVGFAFYFPFPSHKDDFAHSHQLLTYSL